MKHWLGVADKKSHGGLVAAGVVGEGAAVVVDGDEVVGVGAAVVAEVAAGNASVQAAGSGGGLRHCSQAMRKNRTLHK